MITSIYLLNVRYFHLLKKSQLTLTFFHSSIISFMLLKNILCCDELKYFPEVTVANKDRNPVSQVPSWTPKRQVILFTWLSITVLGRLICIWQNNNCSLDQLTTNARSRAVGQERQPWLRLHQDGAAWLLTAMEVPQVCTGNTISEN